MDSIKRSSKGLIIILVVAFAVGLVFSKDACAGNASREIGFSSRDEAMGGATTASSADTSCLIKNPAGLVKIGNRVDLQYQNILFHDVTMDTEGPVSGYGFPLVNVGLRQSSDINYLPGVNAGVSYKIPGMDKYPVSVGFGIFTIGGMALDYDSSRLTSVLVNNYDKMVDLRVTRLAPGIAVAFTDKLSFGAVANVDIQELRTNLAQSNFLETSGGGKWDTAVGGGFTAGLLYQFNDMFGAGVSYESHEWLTHHYRYKDCLPYIDEPPVISVGLSFKPIKNLELTYDTRYINWTDVKLARLAPKDGGFGWRDQWVFAAGTEYTYKDKLKLRLGYNYGKSPIQPNVAFANALLPVIVEHHLTTGFSYFLTKDLSLDMTWEHGFKNVMTDSGGDSSDSIGAGTKISAAVDIIGVGLGYTF